MLTHLLSSCIIKEVYKMADNRKVWLIIVDDHQEGMNYHICATEAAADKLFQKIVKENYFEPEEDTKADFEEACEQWFWESQYGDVVTCSQCHALSEEEI